MHLLRLLIICCLIVISIAENVQTPLVESETAACRQLGCDSPGNFKQDSFKVPSSQPKLAWKSKQATILPMRPENENYGCIASDKLVVCPLKDKILLPVRYVLLNPDTGEEMEAADYDIQTNISMPILTKQNLVFGVNQSHVSLVNPWMKKSVTEELPQPFELGVLSPLYLPDLDFYLVVGNFSDRLYIYQVDEAANRISFLTEISINKTKSDCGFMTVNEIVANGNRIYFYGYHIEDTSGVIAVDLMKTAPYFKTAWQLTDDGRNMKTRLKRSSKNENSEAKGCINVPDVDPDYAWFPPANLQIQMLATPDGYIVITAAVELMVVKDHGNSGEQIFGNLFGAHFITLDYRPETNYTPAVWMSGWQLYPPFRVGLIGYNYTSDDPDTNLWESVLPGVTETSGDANITSRITSFPDPQHKDKRIMVFGASLLTKKRSDWLHTHYLLDKEPGIHKVVMALRTKYNSTDLHPDVVWITPIETTSNEFEVKGQIVGVLNKLIMYVSTGKLGYVMAIQ